MATTAHRGNSSVTFIRDGVLERTKLETRPRASRWRPEVGDLRQEPPQRDLVPRLGASLRPALPAAVPLLFFFVTPTAGRPECASIAWPPTTGFGSYTLG